MAATPTPPALGLPGAAPGDMGMMLPGPGMDLGLGLGMPPSGGPAFGLPSQEKEIDVEAKDELKKSVVDIYEEGIEDTDKIFDELQSDGWTAKRLRELFPEKDGGVEGFIDSVKAEELGDGEVEQPQPEQQLIPQQPLAAPQMPATPTALPPEVK